jgi:quercetin dioxygenase-like cupin family protein
MSVRNVNDVPTEPVEAGRDTSRQVLIGPDEGPNFAMRRFILAPGGSMPAHTNTVEHEQYVLRGRAEIAIGDERRRVGTGDVVFIPANVPHWYRVEGDESFEFLCIVPNLPDTIELVSEEDR